MEPISTAICSGIAGKIAEYSVEPIKRQVDYVIHCKSNLAQLEIELNDLTDAKSTIEGRIAEANEKGAIILEEVNKWVEQVEAVTREANQLKDESRAANLNCVNGCCLNLRMRRQLSKQSIELMKDIARLMNRKKELLEISSGYHREEVAGISTGDYMPFDSRESALEQLMNELKNPNTVRIGVCGIGGVGKTTLVKEVFRRAKQDTSLFDKVAILFDVKSIQDLEGIQKQIVEKLGMDLEKNETMVKRASRLCGYIKDKKILIIVDDVQTRIDLEQLGVPGVATCKILLTSRIPIPGMSTDKGFKLGILPEKEARELFATKAAVLDKVPAIQSVAKDVAEKCGGLPVLIVTVASSLKDKNSPPLWEEALRCLKEFDHTDESPEKKAHSTIEWSYNQLDDSLLKPLFLLCGTTVRGNRICLEDLFKYSMGLSEFKNDHTVEQTRNAYYSKVEKLKDFCLLIDGEDDTSVRMHDIVRDAARHIALRDHHMLSAGDDQSDGKGWPNKDFTEKCTTISFPSANNIPEVLQFPALKMFLLQVDRYVDSLKILPRLSFEETKQLRVLSLGHMRIIPSLPPSLLFLKNLQTLCLHQCVLEDLSLVGQLNNLEILSLEGSHFKQLPKEIGQLTRLRLLDLSECERLKVVSPGVISSLTRLEELRMRESFNNWKAAGDGSNASPFELNDLSRLTALEVHVPDANILPADFLSHELKRFQIMIGDEWEWDDEYDRTLNTLKLKLTTTSNELERGLKKLLKICDDLSLDGTESVNHIVRQLDSQDCPQLRHLLVRNNVDFEYVRNKDVLTFMYLTTLRVDGCHSLSFLFSFSIAKSLAELKHLEISECEILEEIVECGQENMDNMFSKLEDLELQSLPNLTKFCSDPGMLVSHWPLLKRLMVFDCPKVESFAAELSFFQEKHELNRQTQQSLFLIDKDVFPNLTTLTVQGCDRLTFLFSFSMAKSLVKLKHLEISECEIMEEIVSAAREENMDNVFSKLEDLKLERLPNLTKFCSNPGMLVSHWPLLKRLKVFRCPKVESFAAELSFFQDKHVLNPQTQLSLFLIDKSSFLNLEHLELTGMEIWPGPPPAELVFGKLKYIQFSPPPAPSVLLLAKLFPNLESINVTDGDCEEIFVNEGNTTSYGEIHAVGSGTLPHVRELTLQYLSNVLHLGNSQSAAGPLFPNLQFLHVWRCERLENLESSTVSFQNLTTLMADGCHGLKYLTSYSVAKSLVQLTELLVWDCNNIVAIVQASNIVGDDDDAAANEIVFNRLQRLRLYNLPRLQGFCSSGNCIVKFPPSVTLNVRHCPIKLNVSPEGVLLTEKVDQEDEDDKDKEEEDEDNKDKEEEDDDDEQNEVDDEYNNEQKTDVEVISLQAAASRRDN